jgi:hypothetical protein
MVNPLRDRIDTGNAEITNKDFESPISISSAQIGKAPPPPPGLPVEKLVDQVKSKSQPIRFKEEIKQKKEEREKKEFQTEELKRLKDMMFLQSIL